MHICHWFCQPAKRHATKAITTRWKAPQHIKKLRTTMLRTLILLLLGENVVAWVPVTSRSHCFTLIKAASQDDGRHDVVDDTGILSRRGMLTAAFTAASLTFLPSAVSSKDSRSSSPSPWPYAPSPLPTASHTPAELSSSVTVSLEGDDPLASFGAELSGMKTINASPSVNATGLNQALEQSSKKKRIDPRTHG